MRFEITARGLKVRVEIRVPAGTHTCDAHAVYQEVFDAFCDVERRIGDVPQAAKRAETAAAGVVEVGGAGFGADGFGDGFEVQPDVDAQTALALHDSAVAIAEAESVLCEPASEFARALLPFLQSVADGSAAGPQWNDQALYPGVASIENALLSCSWVRREHGGSGRLRVTPAGHVALASLASQAARTNGHAADHQA